LAGHIHRAQLLTHDLAKRPLAAPVIYPGSVERTSFAERNEEKSYVILNINLSSTSRAQSDGISFVPLPARPMVDLLLEPGDLSDDALAAYVRQQLSALDPEAIVRVRLDGSLSANARSRLSAARLRALAPSSMNITLARDHIPG
jgi:DNA repair exonuclease SbcCD nuclease subunit